MFTVKIDGSRAVLVDLGDDSVQIVGRQLVIEFVKNFPQYGSGDVSVACLT